MLFGKRQRALRTIVSALKPLVQRAVANNGGVVPRGFWNDAYALGYLLGTATHFARLVNPKGMKEEDLGMVLIMALRKLSGSDAETITDRILYLQQSSDPDFRRAVDASEKPIAWIYEIIPMEHDPLIRKATRIEGATLPGGEKPARPVIAWRLHQILFYDVLEKRLG